MATPTPVPPPTPPPLYRGKTLTELYTRKPPVWLIKYWAMRQTITLLTGKSGSFKTFIAIDLAMRASTPPPTFTTFGPKGFIDRREATAFGGSIPVLYIMGESQDSAAKRFKSWEQRYGIPEGTTPLIVHDNRVDLFTQGEMVKELVDFHDPDIVIFDTWSKNTPGMDENSKKEVDRAMNIAHEIKMGGDRGGRNVMFLHHPTKGDDDARGHSSMVNDSDIMIRAERLVTDDPSMPVWTKLISKRQKEVEDFYPYWVKLDRWHLRDSTGSTIIDADGEPVTSLVVESFDEEPTRAATGAGPSITDQIFEYVQAHPGAKATEIQMAIWGKKGSNVYERMDQLKTQGKITGNKDGYEVVVPVLDPMEDL